MEGLYSLLQKIAPIKRRIITDNGSAFLLDPDGSCWAFGGNYCGELGLGSYHYWAEWTKLPLHEPVEKLFLRNGTSLLITKEGKCYIAGRGYNFPTTFSNNNKLWGKIQSPCQDIRSVALGFYHSLVLSDRGLCFGTASNRGLKYLGLTETSTDWVNLPVPFPLKEVFAHSQYSIICSEIGQYYGLGSSINLSLESSTEWTLLTSLKGENKYYTNYHKLMCLTKTELGKYINPSPLEENSLPDKVRDIYPTDFHTLLLTEKGACYGIGRNEHSALGLNSYYNGKVEEWTHTFFYNNSVEQLITSNYDTYLLTKEGKWYYTGDVNVKHYPLIRLKLGITEVGTWHKFSLPFP